MQKKIIALAIAAMASGAVMAQSNVTIYGTLDASGYYNHSAGAGTTYGFASNNYTSSNMGFKGTEDLGGGLKANFNLEEELSLGTGNTGSSSSGAGAANNNGFNRKAFVGLEGGYGRLELGRQATPTFGSIGAIDAFGMNSGGFVNAWVRSNLTGTRNTISGITDASTNTNGGLLLPGAYAAGVMYVTPSFSGLQAKVFINAGNGSTGATYKSNGIRDLGVAYDNGPVGVRFASQAVSSTAAYAIGTQSWSNVITESRSNLLGGSYNFGTFKLTGAWSKTTYDSFVAVHDTRIWSLGGTYAASSALRLGISYTNLTDATNTANTAKNTSFLADYNLSKRTNIYALLTSVNNKGTAALNGLYGGNAINTVAGSNLNGLNGTNTSLALGLRHMF